MSDGELWTMILNKIKKSIDWLLYKQVPAWLIALLIIIWILA